MGRLTRTFESLLQAGDKALITFVTAGDPNLGVTEKAILTLEEAGADIIELGVPFSDPMADGPTIQKSSERALAAGTSLNSILAMVKSVRASSQVPIILMGYYNPIFLYGVSRFVRDAAEAGVDGVLLVDLPPEEAKELKNLSVAAGIDMIFLLAPTSDNDRIAKVSRLGSGFIYYVSVAGVTGARSSIAATVFADVAKIKKCTDVPVVVGFGVSDGQQAGQLAAVADGVVVGSAIVKLFETYKGKELQSKLADFVADLKSGIRSRAV